MKWIPPSTFSTRSASLSIEPRSSWIVTFSKLAVIVPLTLGEIRMFIPLRRLINSINWRTSSSLVCIEIRPALSNWISGDRTSPVGRVGAGFSGGRVGSCASDVDRWAGTGAAGGEPCAAAGAVALGKGTAEGTWLAPPPRPQPIAGTGGGGTSCAPATASGFGGNGTSVSEGPAKASSLATGSAARSDAASPRLSTSALIPKMTIRFKGNDPCRFGTDPHADKPTTLFAWDQEVTRRRRAGVLAGHVYPAFC